MTKLRKALFGYDLKEVSQHIRSFKFYSNREILELQELLHAAQKECSGLVSQLQALQADSQIAATAELIAEPAAEIAEVAAEIAEVAAEPAEPAAEIAEVAAEPAEPAAEIAEPAAEIAEPAAEIAEPAAEITEVAAEIAEPAAEISEVAAEISEVAAEIAEVAAEIAEVAAEIAEVAAEIAEVAAEISEPAAEIAAAETSAAATPAVSAVPTAPQKGSISMGRLLQFRRKLDVSLDPDEDEQPTPSSWSAPIKWSGFWESADHYLTVPAVAEDLGHLQTVIASVHNLSNAHMSAASSSAAGPGVPSYFDYSLNEAIQLDSLSPDPMPDHVYPRDRRAKSRIPEAPASKARSRDEHAAHLKEGSSAAHLKETATPVRSEATTPSLGSKAITKEVRQLRYKYIVGKWAGADLYTNRGTLIVGKNSPITEEVVDAANEEGKLALLIVDMTIPGLGDEV
jgi:hypothetical protein